MKLLIISASLLVVLCIQTLNVAGHGRLMDPPSRNAMWRFGFPNPVNAKDNELWCGGLSVQWDLNKGKCGACGDPWNEPRPRLHETGGHYANGLLGRRYSPGQIIDLEVELTSNHEGHFETYLCPLHTSSGLETDECFERFPLYLEGQSTHKFNIPPNSGKHVVFKYRVKLPNHVTCAHCVLQWIHYGRHINGTCDDGTISVGCGNQETYRNCADVAIVPYTGGFEPFGIIPMIPTSQNVNPYAIKLWNTAKVDAKEHILVVRSQSCAAIGKYQGVDYFDNWCMTNCMKYPPTCPDSACRCLVTCIPKENILNDVYDDQEKEAFCQQKCLRSPFDKGCSQICDCY